MHILSGMDLRKLLTNPANTLQRPRPARHPEPVTVPDVRGLRAGQARSVLRHAGLNMAGPRAGLTQLDVASDLPDLAVGLTTSVLSSWLDSRSRRVTVQDPPGGTTAQRGDTVTIWTRAPHQGPAAYA